MRMPIFRKPIYVTTLILTIMMLTFAGKAAAGELADLNPAPHIRLGLSFPGDDAQYYAAIADGGMGVARISVSWKYREPSPGQYEWAGLDMRVFEFQRQGIEPFFTFESDADWATREETHGITNGTPIDYNVWRDFVLATVERYDGDGSGDMPGLRWPVKYYQVANEWTSSNSKSGGWLGTLQELIDFINVAHDAVKERSPTATFVLGGIASGGLDGLVLNLGMADYEVRWKDCATCITTIRTAEDYQTPEGDAKIHEYFAPVLSTARYDYLDLHLYGPAARDSVRIAAVRQFSEAPMLSAECGGPSLSYEDYTPEGHFMAVVERNLIDLSEGLDFCLWFRLGSGSGTTYGNSRTGLFDDQLMAKPGYHAYKMLAFLLEDAVLVERGEGNTYLIHREGKPPLFVGWLLDGQSSGWALLPESVGPGGRTIVITDPVPGIYQVGPYPKSGVIMLSPWPTIVGQFH